MHTQRNSNGIPRNNNKMHNTQSSVYSLSVDEKLLVMEALDHLHVTLQYQEMGSCTVCKKISLKKCSGCNSFYCSSECQTFDWPTHRANCSKQQDSFSDRDSFASSRRMRASSVKDYNEEPLMINDRSSPFTALTNQLKKKNGNVVNGSKSLANFKIGNKQYQKKEHHSAANDSGLIKGGKEFRKNNSYDRKRNLSPKKSQNNQQNHAVNPKSSPEEKKAPVNKNNTKNSQKDWDKKAADVTKNVSDDNQVNSKPETRTRNLPKLEGAEVIATFRESPNRYWVMLLEDLTKYEEIQAVLNTECKNFEEVDPKVGLICGCDFAGEWFRAEVLSVNPDVMVSFIDYGNISNCDGNGFKKLPDQLTSIPGLAFQIEFEEGTPQKYKIEDLDCLKLKVEETTRTSDGVRRVKIIEGLYGPTEVPLKLAKPPQKKKTEMNSSKNEKIAMDVIDVNTSGMLFFLPGNGVVRYASIVPDNNREASESLEKVLSIDTSNSSPINAKDGDLVIVTDGDGNDQRGRVVLKLGYLYFVQLIDCGNVITSEKVYAIPEDLKDLMELGVYVWLQEILFIDEFNRMETFFFNIMGEAESGKWPCILKNAEKQIIAEVLLEKPKILKPGWRPKYAYLKSGSTVEISAIISPNSFYVRPVDVEIEQKFLDMNMEMTQFANRSKGYEVYPLPGELCCAKYLEDGCFYRAVVMSSKRRQFLVLFVDFGNQQETDFKDIKPLPEMLRNVPLFAVRVQLKNVSTKPWNNMIKEYIGKLTSENVELTMTYTESLSNGVILREKVSGVVVNDFMEKSKDKIGVNILHSQRSLTEKKEIFLDDDMQYSTLPVGRTCTLAVLYVCENEFKTSFTFWATSAEEENFNHVNVELSSLICEHCESVAIPYEPSYRELCLAEYEGSWYRAICAGNEGELFKVFFVDFGNCCELKSESIRKMDKKFLKAPALAMNCTLTGREQLKHNKELVDKIFANLLERINTFTNNVIVKKFEEDTYALEIPEIKEMMSY